ncbi:hypothetical protein LAC1533_2333 [Ligilactobacillus acidipiscis]|uniref:Integral membrane protein n=2 Tax=Ligilactobacillus acidipiscis TaxID=89059 RepID=A0A1K1KS62_9LACO|nr:hypothetical protein LAC1533_2333 [Ligilactobacillus acidipiscis]
MKQSYNNKVLLIIKRCLIILALIYLSIGTWANIYNASSPLNSLVLLPLIIIGPLLFKMVYSCINGLTVSQLKKAILFSFAIMILVQLYVLIAMPATVYHDAFRTVQQAEQISTGDIDWTSTYFLRNPNNVPIVVFLGQWFKFTNFLGLSPNVALSVLKLLIFDGMIVTILAILKEIKGDLKLSAMAAIFFLLSPYSYTYNIQVFYTDTPIFLACAVTVLILLKWQERKNSLDKSKQGKLLLFPLFGACLLAQIIKPNFLIFAIAALITTILLYFFQRLSLKKILAPLVTIILAIGLAFPAGKLVNASVDYHYHQSYELPTLHWVEMGLNAKSYGMYSVQDTKRTLKIKNLKKRQTAAKKVIKQRVKKLGFFDLNKLWVTKMGILLKVNYYNQAYTGGFVQSPSWFQKHQRWWSATADIMLRCSFIFLYSQALLALVNEFKKHQTAGLIIFLLLVINGYLTAHMLFWEAEERYGQVIFPLLVTVIGLDLSSSVQSFTFVKTKRWLVLRVLSLIAVIIFVGGNYLVLNKKQIQGLPVITVAQRSQLSDQYHAKVVWLEPGEYVTQNMWVKSQNNYFSFLKAPGSRASAILTNIDKSVSYNVTPGHLKFKQNKFEPGKYQLRLYNATSRRQPVWLVRTHHYQLGQEPANISEPDWGKRTLIYLFGQTQKNIKQ